MTARLTLSIEKEVIKLAKLYASKNGLTLSVIVENYLRVLVANENRIHAISARVRSLRGVVKVPKDFDYKKELEKTVLKKHLR